MTTANESKLGGARGGHRGPIVLRVAAARVLPLLPVAARGARLVLSMGLAAGCVRARSSSSPLRGGHCPPLAASTCVCVCVSVLVQYEHEVVTGDGEVDTLLQATR